MPVGMTTLLTGADRTEGSQVRKCSASCMETGGMAALATSAKSMTGTANRSFTSPAMSANRQTSHGRNARTNRVLRCQTRQNEPELEKRRALNSALPPTSNLDN